MLYVTVAFGVPVSVNNVLPFSQIVVGLALTLAVGKGKTVIVILLGCELTQLGVPVVATLTMFTTVLAVKVTLTVAVPEPFSVMV
jgi:hypothetical protein